jgi:PIN domain nuclease of toxin-antitoxin system
MRLLLDTHVFLAVLDFGAAKLPTAISNVFEAPASELYVSVVSLWEVAIKVRSR